MRSFDRWFCGWQSWTSPVYITLHTVKVLFTYSRVLIAGVGLSGPLQVTHITFRVIEALKPYSFRLKGLLKEFFVHCNVEYTEGTRLTCA